MKNFIFILVAIFIVGCSQKEMTVYDYAKKSEEQRTTLTQEEIFQVDTELYEQQDIKNKIAVVFPSKVVGKYATGTINTIVAKLLSNQSVFNLETIDIYEEDEVKLETALKELSEKEYKNLILLITPNGLNALQNSIYTQNFSIYLPLINKKESHINLDNVVYGGIDYEVQVQELLKLSNGQNSIFSTQSTLGAKLRRVVESNTQTVLENSTIEPNRTNFKSLVNKKSLNNSTLFLNTSIVTTSILLSQLRVYEITPSVILSTQLNYTPLVISLTQYLDRERLYIANSIGKVDENIEEVASLLDADLVYNWVNYSSLIGVEYLLNEDKNSQNLVIDNQVQYSTTIYKNGLFGFQLLR